MEGESVPSFILSFFGEKNPLSFLLKEREKRGGNVCFGTRLAV